MKSRFRMMARCSLITLLISSLLLPGFSISVSPESESVALEQESLQDLVSKRTVELVEKRTETSKVYELADGCQQVVISSSLVHYEDEFGMWQDIQPVLTDEANIGLTDVPLSKEVAQEARQIAQLNRQMELDKETGLLDRNRSAFRTLQTPFDLKINKVFTDGYSIGKGQDKLTLLPVGAESVKGTLLNASTVLYPNAWADTDVTLEVTRTGVKETITVHSPNAPSVFTYEVIGELTEQLTSGSLRILPAWLVDANGIKRSVSLKLRTENGQTYLDMTYDATTGLLIIHLLEKLC